MRRPLIPLSVALVGLVGCGDEYYIGLGHTYAQMQARSADFEHEEKTPFRWGLPPGKVHLDLGGAWFVFEDAGSFGVANHPNPNLDNLELTDWSEGYVIELYVDTHELVGLDDAESPRRLLKLMDAIRAVGWVPKEALPSSADEVKTAIAGPPYRVSWVFLCPVSRDVLRPTPCPALPPLNTDGTEPERPWAQTYIELIVMWDPEDTGKRDFERRGVHTSVKMTSWENFDVRLLPPFRP